MAHLLDFIQNHGVEIVLTTLYVLVDEAYPIACAALGWGGRERGTEPNSPIVRFSPSFTMPNCIMAAMRRWLGRSLKTIGAKLSYSNLDNN